MSGPGTIDVAVVGASTLIGGAVIAELRTSKFPYARIFRLEELRDIGRLEAEEDDEAQPALDVEQFDFSTVKLVFFCSRAQVSRTHAARAAAHAWVIEGSGAFRDATDAPMIAADVNPRILDGSAVGQARHGMIVMPGSASVALATAVAPLHRLAGLSRVDVATYHCVSGSGRAALEELARECAALLNGQEPKVRGGGERIAFNVIPQVDALDESGASLEELRLQSDARRLLGLPALAVNATAVRVPVFFGHGLAIHAAFDRDMTLEQARETLRTAPGVQWVEADASPPYPTPAGKSLAPDRVTIGRLRLDSTRPGSLNMWVVADNVRKCAAINAVSVAHILVNRYC